MHFTSSHIYEWSAQAAARFACVQARLRVSWQSRWFFWKMEFIPGHLGVVALAPRLKQFVAPNEANFLWSQNNSYWRLLESALLGSHWPLTKCFIWTNVGIMINYLVKPIKQKNQNTNPNQREPAPRHHISFSCHFQGEIPPEKKTFESLYISQIISCGESEASISQIQITTQSTRDYWDKHVLNQITGNPGSPSMVTC